MDDLDKYLEEQLKDPEFKKEFEAYKPKIKFINMPFDMSDEQDQTENDSDEDVVEVIFHEL